MIGGGGINARPPRLPGRHPTAPPPFSPRSQSARTAAVIPSTIAGNSGSSSEATLGNDLSALPAIMALTKAAQCGGAPANTLELMHLQASQINGSQRRRPAAVAYALVGGPAPERRRNRVGPGLVRTRQPGMGTRTALQREVRVPKPTRQGHLAGFGEDNQPQRGCNPPSFSVEATLGTALLDWVKSCPIR